ncbi:SDR family oxidoreductase [Thermosipho ferrireducens]|uniref:SDR family oxidoreductase n=1 Tax=Thermosipho ferrireducens TaxID=2571116 RepID=A0ABX7SA11_9BACT|nr:SDR family oxidoreductase [Thermosipho ferrireducens]QTA38725.1 SDR family oxidoreductase [Thermosipho ferrireducens]
MNWLITGANRGIGLALTREVLKKGYRVIAAIRNVRAESLNLLMEEGKKLVVKKLDVSDSDSIANFSERLEYKINVIINNAGILLRDKFPNLPYENFIYSFKVNTLGALFLIQELYRRGKIYTKAKIVNIDSILGSINHATGGVSYSYSLSKAALNMVTKLLSQYLVKDNIVVISIHPGWVKTDMGGMEAPLTPEESAKGIINVIENLTMNDTGKFFEYNGKELEW